MKRILFLILLLIITIPTILAECSEGQIDINSASIGELDKIVHVGKSVAGYIIDARPFNSLDELVNVRYISEDYLIDIKSQGLACVEDEKNTKDNKTTEDKEEKNETIINKENIEIQNQEPEIVEVTKLSLPKDIKTNNNSSSLGKIAIYGLLLFCILLIIKFTIKIFKRKDGIC